MHRDIIYDTLSNDETKVINALMLPLRAATILYNNKKMFIFYIQYFR